MSILTRTMLPVFALTAMMAAAQAQPATGQNHDAHHPGGGAPAAQPGMMGGMGRMMGSMGGTPGGMHTGMMGGGMMGGTGLPFEHVEGRIAFLKTELKITDAQLPQWTAVADALRANAREHQTRHERMSTGGMPSSWPDRLAAQQGMLTMRLDALKRLEAAAKPLYAVLTDEQKTLADTLLSGPMGAM